MAAQPTVLALVTMALGVLGAAADWDRSSKPEFSEKANFAAGAGRGLQSEFSGSANSYVDALATGTNPETQSNYLDTVEINRDGVTSTADTVGKASSEDGTAAVYSDSEATAKGRHLLQFFRGSAATEADGRATGQNPESQSNYQADVEFNRDGITSFADGVSKASSVKGTAETIGEGSASAEGGFPGRRLLQFFRGSAATEADGRATGQNPESQSNYQADVEFNRDGITSFADGVSKASSVKGTAETIGEGSASAEGGFPGR